MAHDFLATYSIKATEYLIGVSFLVSFVFFWRWVQGGQPVEQRQPHAQPLARPEGLLSVPEAIFLHPGHAWARLEGAMATVGLDDFAQRLVGAVSAVELPAVGARVGQGEKAWRLKVGDKAVDMLAPIDGTVVAVNEQVARDPAALKSDPYGAGWLLKIEPSRQDANLKQLFSGERARSWAGEALESLLRSASPELGPVAADGGVPVDGLAKALAPERWDEIARSHFLT